MRILHCIVRRIWDGAELNRINTGKSLDTNDKLVGRNRSDGQRKTRERKIVLAFFLCPVNRFHEPCV